MLINIFKSNQKVVSLLVLSLSILLWIPSFWVDQNLIIKQSIPFHITNKIIVFSIASLLIGFQSIYLNYIVNEFKLLSTRTHLPALLFIVLNAGISILLVFTPLLLVNTLSLLVLHQLLLIHNQNNAFSLSFNVGFILAIASLIYFPVVIVFPLLWITLLYTKPPNWRELIIAVLGFLVPIAFYASYYFLTDQILHLITFGWGGYRIFKPDGLELFDLKNAFFYTLLVTGLAVSLHLIKSISNHIVKVKKHIVITLLMLAALFATRLLNNSDTIATYILMTIPLSILYADYLNSIKKKWLAELVFSFLLISILVGYFS